MPRKHLKRRDEDEKTSWETKLQAASVAAAVAQAGHDQLLGSCAAVRCSPGMHSTCQAAGQLSQHTRLPPLWHLLGHSSLLSSLAAAAGARHLPTSEISLFPPFAEIREIIPEMAFSRGILPPAGAAQTPLQQGVLAQKTSWRPKLFLATAQKHCGKPKNYLVLVPRKKYFSLIYF